MPEDEGASGSEPRSHLMLRGNDPGEETGGGILVSRQQFLGQRLVFDKPQYFIQFEILYFFFFFSLFLKNVKKEYSEILDSIINPRVKMSQKLN